MSSSSEENTHRTVCFCHAVRYDELVEAFQKGAKGLREIQMETLATTGCGGCEIEVLEILGEQLELEKQPVLKKDL